MSRTAQQDPRGGATGSSAGTQSSAPNPIDENRQGLIGKAVDRVEGPLKVSGRATYAYEYAGEGKAAYGIIVGATIARGRITAIDTGAAERMPGVLLVMTYRDAPPQQAYGQPPTGNRHARAKPYLYSNRVRYRGEPVAFVVARTFEIARAAAAVVAVTYAAEPGAFRVASHRADAYAPKILNADAPTDTATGDFDGGFASAPVRVDATYTTPYQHHNPIEPHASMAVWEGDRLTIYVSTQLAVECRDTIANTLQIPHDRVRVLCKYIGGGFGSKLPTEADAVLSAIAARQLRRPVKTALTRQQSFVNASHRTESIQRIRLGASRDGTMIAIGHDVLEHTGSFGEFAEETADYERALYAAPNRRLTHRLVRLDLPMPDSMRAPGEAIGMLAGECAIDELAVALKMDPIELRRRNEPATNPVTGLSFSTRHLVRCMEEGARRFGWERRPATPGTRREGPWLIGYGMSAAIRNNYLKPSQARVRLARDGRLRVEMAMTDIGTGSYTILTQIAAEMMGLPLDAVTIDIGDSALPPTPGSGGSFGAASSGSGLYNACMNLRAKLARAAVSDARSPLHGAPVADVRFARGAVMLGDPDDRGSADARSESFSDLLARVAPNGMEATGAIAPGENQKAYSQHAFGAHFAEVGVDADTGEIRVRRLLGVFDGGRILNAKTARSQLMGGMLWGLSSALCEETMVDERYGLFVNHDLAEYHVPVHADIPDDIDVIMLPEADDKANPLKIKGLGELGICGAGAAVANAVYNACGVRVRDFPITLDKVLAGLS